MVLGVPTHTADDASRSPRLRLLHGVLRRSVARWSFLRGESSCAADKRQLIDDIREVNATASVRFLLQFDRAALRAYRDHLRAAGLSGRSDEDAPDAGVDERAVA